MIPGNPKYDSYLEWFAEIPSGETKVNDLDLSKAIGLWDEPLMSNQVEESYFKDGTPNGERRLKGEKKIYASVLEAAMEVSSLRILTPL